ncbi:membrane-bound PQQ-dependent dehydrogenase, glucose/quinate/shikimate family [Xinfangfangia sp. D13-10-4-6]|uniref:membrane-bound PQQ-dependent dehydrogenase, glucose/quinate/shikimate family n=1 Tax=Pseudogemmobacter hezensis TaxID=2737662 RepID=UPI0015555A43|nr:membrane-bound PQQ-dependent dehydrogenase, glucose/quinate/shikimate family [Pseudogemmobacter hezensis]NPD16002.1 membrane-bound PQQ-dependent dehydrogenase, glucose/quinate/shikimate family [Pseudogemmobacter hezensis]
MNDKTVAGSTGGGWQRLVLIALGGLLALVGLWLAVQGIRLISLGGSWYYLITGILLVITGGLYIARKPVAALLLALTALGTLAWAYWEVGSNFWGLVPRLAPFLVMGLVAGLIHPIVTRGRYKAASFAVAALFAVALAFGFAAMLRPHGVTVASVKPQLDEVALQNDGSANWEFYGNDPEGTRYVPFDQINKDNVKDLEVAWSFRSGELAEGASESQNTPSQIGDTVYTCTPTSEVIALNADTGDVKWRHREELKNTKTVWNRCRGVGYYEPASVTNPYPVEGEAHIVPAAGSLCSRRIIQVTMDADIVALDAETGALCTDFGQGGKVSMMTGLGDVKFHNSFSYAYTSAPTIIRNLIVVGGWVFDGRALDEPSGVIRAFSADTGALVWAWDLGNPEITKLPPEGETYTRGTPNMWTHPAFDEELGLVYMPLGNEQPDFWGGSRTAQTEKFSSGLVALDIATGRDKWVFQTVHHDIWDYDLASQPSLYTMPDGVPALALPTKRGQIFLLDRRDGKPIAGVEELPAPQGAAYGDWTAETQPHSTEMPGFGTKALTEADMWGVSFIDQLSCRIAFKELNYQGEFTAPQLEPTLIYPGYYGGFNWGSAALDKRSGYLFVNDIRMPQVVTLRPAEGVDFDSLVSGHGVGSTYPMIGTPFVIDHAAFNSPLGLPCNAPPWGVFGAVDLKTKSLVWERPAGTVEDVVVGGIRAGLPVPLGMPTLGGGVVTASGLVFYAGTQDFYLRAMDIETGEEVWKGRLPVGAQATPMSYVSPETGKQYVVIVAGGARQSPVRGDYVIAYALPDKG